MNKRVISLRVAGVFLSGASAEDWPQMMGPGFQGPTEVTPIKAFVKARNESVADQLEGKSEGKTINPGFGRR